MINNEWNVCRPVAGWRPLPGVELSRSVHQNTLDVFDELQSGKRRRHLAGDGSEFRAEENPFDRFVSVSGTLLLFRVRLPAEVTKTFFRFFQGRGFSFVSSEAHSANEQSPNDHLSISRKRYYFFLSSSLSWTVLAVKINFDR
jgi:hypothetical protein